MVRRIEWIDFSKTICIFFVVLGHSNIPHEYKSLIYVFHIPLFFFISGTLFSFDKYNSYKFFLKKKVSQLLIPYLIFNLLTYVFWMLIGKNVGNDVHLTLNPIKPLLGIFYGVPYDHYLEHNIPLWFLICLFVVENIYYFIFNKLNSNIRIFVIPFFLLFGYLDYKYQFLILPWGLNVGISMLFFYGIGSILNPKLKYISELKVTKLSVAFITSALLVFIIAKLNDKIEISVRVYNNYFLFVIGAIAGIVMVITFSRLFENVSKKSNIMLYIGQNTLIILAFHLLSGSFIKGVTFYIFKLPLSIYDSGWVAVIYSIASICFLIPLMLFVNKYTPVIVGKPKS